MSFAKIRPRRGTANQWSNANPILAEGEIGIEVPSTGVGTGTVKIKFGDGSTHWNDLPYGVDTIGNNTDMISEKFIAGTPCIKDNYYIANDTLYKCLNNTDGNVDVSNTNYFKKTTIGAELSSEIKPSFSQKYSFDNSYYLAGTTASANVTLNKTLSEINTFLIVFIGSGYVTRATNTVPACLLIQYPSVAHQFNIYLGGRSYVQMNRVDDTHVRIENVLDGTYCDSVYLLWA